MHDTVRPNGSHSAALPPPNWPAPPPAVSVDITEERPRHLRDYLAVVQRHLRLALTVFAATVALALLVTLVMPRRYTASTRIQVSRQSPIQLRLQQNVVSLDDADPSDRGATSFLATQVSALRSRDLAERVLRHHGLAHSAAFLDPGSATDTGKVASMPPTLRPRAFDPSAIEPLDRGTADAPIDARELIDTYLRYLTVRDVPGTNAIEVSFVTPSAALSAFLAAAHTQAYMDANEDARNATDAVARSFLGRKLAEAKRRVKRADAALARFAAHHPSVAVDQEHKVGSQQLADVAAMLTKAETDRVSLESRYEFLTGGSADPLAYFLDRPGVQKLRLAILDVRAERAGLEERLGGNHPRMVELKRLDTELSSQLRAEVARGVSKVRAYYDAAKQREDRLRRKLDQQQDVGTELNRLGARYDLLKNDVIAARNLHSSLLEQQMATAVNSDLTPTNVRILERAEVPQHPSRPKLPLNLALGIAAGLVFGLGAAFARDYFDQSVRSTADLETLLQVPTLGAIPNLNLARRLIDHAPGLGGLADTNGGDGVVGDRTDELVVLHQPESQVAEAFRAMRTALLFSTGPTEPRVIVVTSARAAEGKTIASLNLATTLALSGARVVVIEADLRHPRCHRMLGIPNVPGLSAYLTGTTADLGALIQPLEPPGLDFLASGPLTRNPAELLGSARMRMALAELRERYDFVIIDTPPVLPVTDAVVLGRAADGVVMVVKGDATPRDVIRRAHERLLQAGAHLLGVIVNNVTPAWGEAYFGDGYYYAYHALDGAEEHGPPDARARVAAAVRRYRKAGMAAIDAAASGPGGWLRTARYGRGGRAG